MGKKSSSQGSALGCPAFRLRLPFSDFHLFGTSKRTQYTAESVRRSLKSRRPRAEPCDEKGKATAEMNYDSLIERLVILAARRFHERDHIEDFLCRQHIGEVAGHR